MDRESPLAGVPVAVKDLFATEGVPSQAGSRILETTARRTRATAVEHLQNAGAPLLGKTNQDEFAMGSSTEHSHYGPTLNPWDRARVPGGSSGGSAAAVAAGTAPWAIGTDTGGSIRQPAALCGIVGMKPTYGAVSRYGMIAFASSLDQAGPFTRDVTDAALLLARWSATTRATRRRSACPSRSRCPSATDLAGRPDRRPGGADRRGHRAGRPEGLRGDAGPGAASSARPSRRCSSRTPRTRWPPTTSSLPAEASSNLARYDGVRYGYRADAGDLLSMYTQTRDEGFGAEVKRRIMLGTYALSSGYYDAYYGRAQKVRTRISEDFKRAWESFDFVATPTSPSVAFELGAKLDDPLAMYLQDVCAVPMSLAGIPAISIPNGLADGLPDRLPAGRPGVQREPHPRRGARARAGDRLRRIGGPRMSASDWEPVIGLEIHVQLKTRTKMFCGCELSFGEEPNTRTCPVCLGLPGSLPVVNARAIHFGLLMGEAFGCEIAPRSIFARKNYFYPDQAKNYQISQYDTPLCGPGELGGVRLNRIHLEEDAAKLVHVGESGRIHGSEASIVDYNRGGTPLAEIVTEPDIHSAEEARDWLNLLRVTLRQLGVSDVNMEEGSLRADANVSVRKKGDEKLGTKTELKNMNSFRFLMQGINAEVKRQIALLEGGDRVTQETLHFDPGTGRLSPLRSKEEAHDYRYFPEPDLVPVVPTEEMLARGARGAARASRPPAPSATSATGSCPPTRRGCSPSSPSGATTSRRPPPRRATSRRARSPTGSPSCAAARRPTWRRPRSARWPSPSRAGRPRPATGARCSTCWSPRAAHPDEIIEREGLGAMEDDGELAGVVARSSRPTRTWWSASRAATRRRWAPSSARS